MGQLLQWWKHLIYFYAYFIGRVFIHSGWLTHECTTGIGIVFPRWCGMYNEMILKMPNAEICGMIHAGWQGARRVLLSMHHGVAPLSRTGIDLSRPDFGTLCSAGVCLLRCNISADLLVLSAPPVELCSHSIAMESSGNHSAGCTLFAQTPVIAPWVVWACYEWWQSVSCLNLQVCPKRPQMFIYRLWFLQEMVLFCLLLRLIGNCLMNETDDARISSCN